MPEPKNKKLYEEVKDEVYKKHPKHSAYRSGLLVKEYKARGGEYIGKKMMKKDWVYGLDLNGKINEGKLVINTKVMYTDLLKKLMIKYLLRFLN